jgi:hypothetical protein
MNTKVMFPRNAIEWQDYVSMHQQQRKGDITNQQMYNPKQGKMMRETRPVAPASSSKNWSEAIWKGYNAPEDLSTYLIPRHEQLKLALFSRYILKDPNSVNNQYMQRAQQRFQQQPQYESVKKYVNSKKADFNQGVVMNPTQQTSDGMDEELAIKFSNLNIN